MIAQQPCRDPNRGTLPCVYVGLPVRNGGEMVARALSSLCNQTYPNISIFVSDNDSTDNTVQLVSELATRYSFVTLFRQSENIGAFANLVFCHRQSSDGYFMFASHDDFWEPEYIDRCVRILLRSPNAVGATTAGVFGASSLTDQSSRPITERTSEARRRIFLRNPGPNLRFYAVWKSEQILPEIFKENFHAWDWFFVYSMLGKGYVLSDSDYVGFHKSSGGLGERAAINYIRHPLRAVFPLFPLYRACSRLDPEDTPRLRLVFMKLNFSNARYLLFQYLEDRSNRNLRP